METRVWVCLFMFNDVYLCFKMSYKLLQVVLKWFGSSLVRFWNDLCRSVSPGVTAVRHLTPVSWVMAVSLVTGRYRWSGCDGLNGRYLCDAR